MTNFNVEPGRVLGPPFQARLRRKFKPCRLNVVTLVNPECLIGRRQNSAC